MIEICRSVEFDAAHRVLGHEGKCRHLHGHRYRVELTIGAGAGQRLDPIGRIIDFGVIKDKLGGWIDENWDHTAILHPSDPLLAYYRASEVGAAIRGDSERERYPYVLPEGNPTAENMAAHLLRVTLSLFDPDERGWEGHLSVKLYETPNCFAVSSLVL